MARPRSSPQEGIDGAEKAGWDVLPPQSALIAERNRVEDTRPHHRPKKRRHKNKLSFPIELIPAGWQYGFVTERVFNEPQPNVQEAYEDGWRYVMQSDHPELIIPQLNTENIDGPIRKGGQVLMKKPMDEWLEDQEYWVEENRIIKEQSAHLTDYLGNSPDRFVEENTSGYSPMRARMRG